MAGSFYGGLSDGLYKGAMVGQMFNNAKAEKDRKKELKSDSDAGVKQLQQKAGLNNVNKNVDGNNGVEVYAVPYPNAAYQAVKVPEAGLQMAIDQDQLQRDYAQESRDAAQIYEPYVTGKADASNYINKPDYSYLDEIKTGGEDIQEESDSDRKRRKLYGQIDDVKHWNAKDHLVNMAASPIGLSPALTSALVWSGENKHIPLLDIAGEYSFSGQNILNHHKKKRPLEQG